MRGETPWPPATDVSLLLSRHPDWITGELADIAVGFHNMSVAAGRLDLAEQVVAATVGSDLLLLRWQYPLDHPGFTHTLFGHAAPVTAAALSPSGSFAVTGDSDGSVTIWDVTRGSRTFQSDGNGPAVTAVWVGDSGERGVSAHSDGSLDVLEVESGRLRTIGGHGSDVRAMSVSDEGSLALVGGTDGAAVVYHLATGHVAQIFDNGDPVEAVELTRNGDRAIVGGRERTTCWDVARGTLVAELSPLGLASPNLIASTPDGSHVVVGSRVPQVWDLDTGKFVRRNRAQRSAVTAVTIDPHIDVCITGDEGGDVEVWPLKGGGVLGGVGNSGGRVDALSVNPDGSIVVVYDGLVEVEGRGGSEPTSVFLIPHGSGGVATSRDGSTCLFFKGSTALLWESNVATAGEFHAWESVWDGAVFGVEHWISPIHVHRIYGDWSYAAADVHEDIYATLDLESGILTNHEQSGLWKDTEHPVPPRSDPVADLRTWKAWEHYVAPLEQDLVVRGHEVFARMAGDLRLRARVGHSVGQAFSDPNCSRLLVVGSYRSMFETSTRTFAKREIRAASQRLRELLEAAGSG